MERTVAPARTNSAPFATAADASERASSRTSATTAGDVSVAKRDRRVPVDASVLDAAALT